MHITSRTTGGRAHFHRFGPPPSDAPVVLALHGVTGHGARWRSLAERLPETTFLAPDLLGHGESSWEPPWTIEAQLDAALAVLDAAGVGHGTGSVLVLGHSYGGLLAVHLSHRLGARARALVLLDPAIALPARAGEELARQTLLTWTMADADDARSRKRAEAWHDVPAHELETEIATHLVPAPGGRVQWRLHPGAIGATWAELTRPAVLPADGVDVDIVIADHQAPPLLPTGYAEAVAARPGSRVLHTDCDHMVPLARPEFVADVIRERWR